MGRLMTQEAGRLAFDESAATAEMSPEGLEQYKLARLAELRAVILSLRSDCEDSLLRDLRAAHLMLASA